MKLILFDLDGTLLSAGGLGQRSSKHALEVVFGTAGNLDRFYPGGRTQEAIFRDTLIDAGFDQAAYLEKRDQLYQVFLAAFQTRLKQGESRIKPLPGALDLVRDFSGEAGFLLGVLTGNHADIASLKLQQAGFFPGWFKVGAYGEESAHRPDLVSLAQQRAEKLTGLKFPGQATVMIGDTTRDVLTAKSVGALSIALTSGTDDKNLLETVNPDHILDHIGEVLEILGKSD
jgi:phosphoglycolate phosphatase-like HAD superfamily hydrolase